MHWVALSQIIRPEFYNNFISGFNFQLISYMSERVIGRIYQGDDAALSQSTFPQIGFINCDGRQHLELLTETLFMGQYMGGSGGSNNEVWGNYNVFDF